MVQGVKAPQKKLKLLRKGMKLPIHAHFNVDALQERKNAKKQGISRP